MVLLVLQKRVQAVEARVPEFFVALQPIHRSLQRTALELTAHHAAGLCAHDEARILQNTEMLDESRQRHAEWLGELTHRAFAMPELREHRTPRGVGECAEDDVESIARIVNHKVKCMRWSRRCQGIRLPRATPARSTGPRQAVRQVHDRPFDRLTTGLAGMTVA